MPEEAAPDPTTDAAPRMLATRSDDPTGPFAEVLAAGSVLDELDDAARVEAWASSALGVWAEAPDAAEYDDEFCAWLADIAAADDPRARQAQLLRAAVTALRPTSEDTGGTDAAPAGNLAAVIAAPPPWIGHLGTAAPIRAWRVTRHGVESVGIGFVASDQSEHSVLADILAGELTALIVAPGPDELFDGSEDLVAPEALDVAAAAERIVDAWAVLVRRGTELPESVHVNGALARARLAAITGGHVDDLRALPAGSPGSGQARPTPQSVEPDQNAVDDDDRAETDRWARTVLDGALGPAPEATSPAIDEMVEILVDALTPARIGRQPALEREAYGALEWADWLGAVIETARRGPGTPLDPEAMVDAVNRCPEVTSSIPRSDRSYYAWAFSLVLDLWRRAGVVDEGGKLTTDGVTALPAALRRAWGPLSPA